MYSFQHMAELVHHKGHYLREKYLALIFFLLFLSWNFILTSSLLCFLELSSKSAKENIAKNIPWHTL